MMNLLGFIMSLVYMQAVHGWLSAYERLVNSQNFFSPYLTQEDMSRFGRDYLQVGMYTDVVFPEFGVHFIAVNDGVDSTRGESEFTAIRNVFNEMYARDTSKKIRATWQSKGKSGEHLTTIPPYGYMKSPEDKKKWIVDEEAAAVVQKIFSLCASGKGPTQIAKWLKQQQILNPTAYCHAKGLPTSNKPTADPYKWTNETVSRILERVDYLGHTVNFKTTKKSYKSKKKIWNDPENWVIFENTQPPIIEESVFLIVQNIRKARRRPTKMGEMGMFSGLLYCAECGGKMYQCRATNFAENQKYFICSTYRKGKDLCTPILSRMLCCMKSFCEICGKQSPMFQNMKRSSFRTQPRAICGTGMQSLFGSAKRWQRQTRELPSLTALSPDCMRTT